MNEWIILLLSIIPHELGHYFAFRFFKVKPKIKFTKWLSIMMGSPKDIEFLNPFKLYIISIAGIFAGLLFLMIFSVSKEIYLTYFLMSLIDLFTIYELFCLPKEYHKLTILDIQIKQAKKTIYDNRKYIQKDGGF